MDPGDLNNMSETKTKDRTDVSTFAYDSYDNNDIAIFEEIRKNTDLVAKSQHSLPLSSVFGHGAMGNSSSFGNRSLVENSMEVDKALKNMGDLDHVWNRSHSQFTWKHINLSWHSPMRNMRQIAAEISAKESALNDAKWNHVRQEIKLRRLEERLSKPEELDYWKEVELKVQLAQMREGYERGVKYIEGAMKDVLALNELYEQLKHKVHDFNEHDVEKEEVYSHLKRSIVQCIRDVRQQGCITKGEQEYMEQIGVNPSKIQNILREFVASEAQQEKWDVTYLHEFVDSLTKELADTYGVHKKVCEYQGFDPEPVEDFSHINRLALLENKNEE